MFISHASEDKPYVEQLVAALEVAVNLISAKQMTWCGVFLPSYPVDHPDTINSRSAEDRPTIYLESTGGYTPIIGGRPAYQFDGTLGKRFLEGNKLGALVSGSYDSYGRGINDIEPGPALAISVQPMTSGACQCVWE